jgi:hypothetical protein
MKDKQDPQATRKRKLGPAPVDERVKEIGRKARIRLEEEKSKRKEIVVLNGDSAPEEARGPKTATASMFSKAITPKKTKPPPRKRSKTAISSAKNKEMERNVDTWSPSTDGLFYYNLSKGETSSIVRLHGLPIGTKVDHIRKFFTGLSPDRVFVLLSNDVIIPGFDCVARRELDRRKKVVKRHDPTFRVFVKFQSATSADVAIGRSGEVMSVDTVKRSKSTTLTAAISISPVSKLVGTHLLNNLAIECHKGTVIADDLQRTEVDFPAIVNVIQWVTAARTLRLDLDIQSMGGTDGVPRVRVNDLFSIYFPSNDKGKEKLIRLHNNLLDIYEIIEKRLTPLQFNEHVIDVAQLSTCSVHRLTNNLAMWLLNEMEKIQRCLCS